VLLNFRPEKQNGPRLLRPEPLNSILAAMMVGAVGFEPTTSTV
jgi:hypothetical protein